MGQFMGEQMAASRAVRLEFTAVENDIRAHRERPCANGSGGLGCDAIGMNFYPAEIMAEARFKMAANDLGKCLDVLRYGHVLKARQLVGVRGAGLSFDGLYYVKKVSSKLKAGEFKQSFSLARNGLISTLPLVPA